VHPRGLLQLSACCGLSITPNQRRTSWLVHGDVAKKLGEKWNSSTAGNKHPCAKKAGKLKSNSRKRILLLTGLKENLTQRKRELTRLKRGRKRRKRRKMRMGKRMKMKKMMRMNKLVLVQVFLIYKAFNPFEQNSFLLKKKIEM
jgi:hypothetical protein